MAVLFIPPIAGEDEGSSARISDACAVASGAPRLQQDSACFKVQPNPTQVANEKKKGKKKRLVNEANWAFPMLKDFPHRWGKFEGTVFFEGFQTYLTITEKKTTHYVIISPKWRHVQCARFKTAK